MPKSSKDRVEQEGRILLAISALNKQKILLLDQYRAAPRYTHRVQITIIQYRIQPNDIYNFNKISFTIGLISTTKIPRNQKWITSIKYIGSRKSLPPYLIFKGKRLFIPFTISHIVSQYRLLILDSHNSYLTPQFNDIYSQNNIIPLYISIHSSYLLQPLNIDYFSPLKRAYGQLIKNKIRLGFNHINKLNFFKAFCHRNDNDHAR
ncbi:unnamed protein product [Aspergillus oryzae RIB40]|uniref:DNA, SC023 n=1 Tax=Aspergillus oryzae (strain ATCC 42149 / RIB 40) TaxID=510516 RepID=Q2UHZ5_ASPOR|nr:unnamed protein product [Aspergillus oryzae RIB40]BAE58820.1 unnamed protein product [Aspergillus oryzae RIB40]